MPYDDALAARVRRALRGREDVTERTMFGGLAFMVRGHMCCGVVGEDLVLRLGSDGAEAALGEPHTRPMDFTGRPMKGFVYVAPAGLWSPAALQRWVDGAAAFVASLPAK
jgi:TfoX/Sxy family transcriptional regulator of competence genes